MTLGLKPAFAIRQANGNREGATRQFFLIKKTESDG